MERYYKALEVEKRFLMNAGGKKYKINNGKLMSNDKTTFTYLFDLEAELFVADDTPVSISLNTKLGEKVSGSVLMCENFQIVLACNSNMGTTVGSAELSVEPWKLLEALQERLRYNISLSKMATEFTGKGPGLATNEPIEKISRGQKAVIDKAKMEPVTIVWGPPGTGKTHTMAEIAIDFLEQKKSILIVSHSNVSVDGVAKKIYEMLVDKEKTEWIEKGKVLRYGYVRDEELGKNPYVNSFLYAVKQNAELDKKLEELLQKQAKIKNMAGSMIDQQIMDIHKEIKKIRSEIRLEEQKYVSDANIVATTISKVVIDKLFAEKKYDVVMFDEVSMAYVPQVVCAATFAKEHLICVGDFMQLPPIAQSEAKTILCEDIFTYLGINRDGEPYYHPWLVMLDEQRRMHPAISEFPIRYVYKNLLKNHASVYKSRDHVVNSYPFYGKPISYVDLTACYCVAAKNDDNSRFNVLSALVSFALAIKAEEENEKVSIITPYAAQTRMIRAIVQDYRQYAKTNIRCATVHQFQGSESDVIIFDAVESFPGEKTGFLMGKDKNIIKRLINVAVTRARGKLIVVGNARFWNKTFGDSKHSFWCLQKYVIDNGYHVNYAHKAIADMVDGFDLGKGISFFTSNEKYVDLLIRDVDNAKEEVLISLPNGEIDEDINDKICKAIICAKKGTAKVRIKTSEYERLPEKLKEFSWGTTNAVFPVIMIDGRITWYGAPGAKWVFKMQPKGGSQQSFLAVVKITSRIEGKFTCDMLSSLANLPYVIDESGDKKPLKEKSAEVKVVGDVSKGMGVTGLTAWVLENIKCSGCHKPIKMTKGKSGKTILYCKTCQSTELLNPQDVNHYITTNQVRCPEHGKLLEARVSKFGLYVKCPFGDIYKPEDI